MFSSISRIKPVLAAGVASLGLLAATAQVKAVDTSSVVDVSAPYSARDVAGNTYFDGGYSVYDGQVHAWSYGMMEQHLGYKRVDIETGNVTVVGKPAVVNSNGYGDPFGIYDPTTGSFYAGAYNDTKGTVYKYDGSAWTTVGNFQSLYGAATCNGELYISGLNQVWNGSTGQDNQIALFDLSRGNKHDVLIQATGNSAHMAVDSQGNVYYANYGTSTGLYRWSAAQINSVRADKGNGSTGGGQDDLRLTYDDAQLLTTLPYGANGITVDSAGNVFVSVNGSGTGGDFECQLRMWSESLGMGNADHSVTIATLDPEQYFGWFGALASVGNVLNGGALYMSNFGSPGLVEITVVPEPVSLALLLPAGLYLLRRRSEA